MTLYLTSKTPSFFRDLLTQVKRQIVAKPAKDFSPHVKAGLSEPAAVATGLSELPIAAYLTASELHHET